MENLYILFVKTNKESRVIEQLRRDFGNSSLVPFIPMVEKVFKSSKCLIKEKKAMFPGYVFVESKMASEEFRDSVSVFIRNSSDVVRILTYGESDEIAVRDIEHQALMGLLNEDGYIEMSSGIVEGSRFRITNGPFIGQESIVKRTDRHRMEAVVEMEMLGQNQRVTIGMEIIVKC